MLDLIIRVLQELRSQVNPDMTNQQTVTLLLIAKYSLAGSKINRLKICELCGVTHQTVQRAIEHLKKAGLVDSQRDPLDQRQDILMLTRKGLDFIRTFNLDKDKNI